MSIYSVTPRSFILALFIRDDGERFLLGDNGFDFKDSQLHFSANTIENDEVAKQGADGVMLAGQVRRATTQKFEGYVGDGTTPKETIESMRRDFIAFFAKGHHFRVVYVDCNRNAWQRKGGYLVDAPEVQELWQIHPEYSVGLNFEDVNYYSYDENAEGEEILPNIVDVPVSADVDGGLVWDEDGAESEEATGEWDTESTTVSGKVININNAVAAPLESVQIDGETSQNGTPTPDAPVPVQTVTGENAVNISDGQNEQSYEIDLASKNLFDVSKAQEYKWLNAGTGWIINSSDPNIVSDYIHVEIGKTYVISGIGGLQWNLFSFEHPGAYGTREIANSTTIRTYTATAEWLRFAIGGGNAIAIKNDVQLEKGSTPTSYADFWQIELCKIGDYQDYIYKSGGDWYVHKATAKHTFNNSYLSWAAGANSGDYVLVYNSNSPFYGTLANGAPSYNSLCSHFTFQPNGATWTGNGKCGFNSAGAFWCMDQAQTTLENFLTWLGTENPTVYYPLSTPTDTEITNQALIAQLEALVAGNTYAGINNIFTATNNEVPTLGIGYYTKYDYVITGGGYVWEQGGQGGPTTIINESITDVSPVWTIHGPVQNPILENITTGERIEYVGTIAEGQTLVIDMGEQTALLNGLNVLANVTGDFISLAPGANTLLYVVDDDGDPSQLGWSEIVG